MPSPERKPLAPSESRVARSIRYSDAEWQPFEIEGPPRDKEPSTLARECSFIGLNVLCTPRLMEAYTRVTAELAVAAAVARASYANGRPA